MSSKLPFEPTPGALEVVTLERKWQAQLQWSTTCYYIGGLAFIGGLIAQVVPWEEADLDQAHQTGWFIVIGAVIVLGFGVSLSLAYKQTHDEYLKVKKKYGIILPGDREYPEKELDALHKLSTEDPEKFRRIMAEARREVEDEKRRNPDG